MSRKLTTENFIERSNKIHNFKYDYSRSVYSDTDCTLEIICPVHGSFMQRSYTHMNGAECTKCKTVQRVYKKQDISSEHREDFIRRAIEIHGNKYDYSQSIYQGYNKKINILCKKHGEFIQLVANHLSNHGCKKCAYPKMSLEEFIKKAKEVHKDFYTYEKAIYVDSKSKLIINCPIHGDFKQEPRNHLGGFGCKECSYIKIGNRTRSNTESFIEKAIRIHGNLYNYSLVEYTGAGDKIKIICKIHGHFLQEARIHLSKCGCPICNKYVGYSRTQWLIIIKKKKEYFI